MSRPKARTQPGGRSRAARDYEDWHTVPVDDRLVPCSCPRTRCGLVAWTRIDRNCSLHHTPAHLRSECFAEET